ncbi:glycoside hydrolase family 5 protein [Silvibacterium acidisoli]|uniref:glycoside hydrolase family 5 protein n=1 Tax=Acidobacteriaceae bacterium ZG23-2 TaxID=2883246 RepID=UPI00406D316F
MRDGKPWIPQGFYQVPFEIPPTAFASQPPFWRQAYEGQGAWEYAEMKAEGADSVRLQIAQDGANPDNKKHFDAEWLQKAIRAIHQARDAGLTVIVCIQDEIQTGVPAQAPLPNENTRRVWSELTPEFGKDRGVLFELYNEPNDIPKDPHPDINQQPTSQQWQRWADAMNETIRFVRNHGSVNVVVADGLVNAQQLEGAPDLVDPMHQVLYAAHPYVSGNRADFNQTEQAWEEKFGHFARTHPVIISEWGIGFYCDAKTPRSVASFLKYLRSRGIGLEVGIWDFAPGGFNNMTHGFPHNQFSSFYNAKGETCTLNNGFPGYGPGKMIESWYLHGTIPPLPQ